MDIKIFDNHTDLLYDVYQSSLRGDLTRFKEYHYPQLKNNLVGGVWTLYSPDDFNLLEALTTSKSLVNLDEFKVVLGIEGLRNLKSVSDLTEIYNLGFRHAMLTWNEENKYATGVKGNEKRGLTPEGYQVLDFMVNHQMIIDLSHLNEKSFDEVLDYTNQNILVSHSNIKELCDHPRNLSKRQLLRLKEANALVSLTLVGAFISEDKDKRTLTEFMKHLKYAVEMMGIDNVSFGFDFMDYFSYASTANIEEVKDASMIKNLIIKLQDEGYSKEEIEKLTYGNFYNRFKKQIFKIGGNDE